MIKTFSTLGKKFNRTFWTTSKGKTIGYIEGVGVNGLFFTNPSIAFRETSSNLSTGKWYNMSIIDISDINDINVISMSIMNRTPVCVTYNTQAYSLPTRGRICDQIYVTKVEPFDSDELYVTKGSNICYKS